MTATCDPLSLNLSWRNVEFLFFLFTCSNSFEVHGSKHGKEGSAKLGFSGVYPMMRRLARRSAGSGPSSPNPRPQPLCCKDSFCSGRGWRGSSSTSETPQWPGQERSMTILQSICTKQWWYENQDGHSVSTKIDQEREHKSDNWRACATVVEIIRCSSFQKIYLNSQNDCDNASLKTRAPKHYPRATLWCSTQTCFRHVLLPTVSNLLYT